jgi:hypothetical protein
VGLFHARNQVGSIVLLVLVAAVIVRPWERWDDIWREQPPRSVWAYVVRAVDGDTIEVQVEGRREDVRYIGVDTPETVKPGTPVQCFGPRAHRFNAALVTHRRVRLEFDAEQRLLDLGDDRERLVPLALPDVAAEDDSGAARLHDLAGVVEDGLVVDLGAAGENDQRAPG